MKKFQVIFLISKQHNFGEDFWGNLLAISLQSLKSAKLEMWKDCFNSNYSGLFVGSFFLFFFLTSFRCNWHNKRLFIFNVYNSIIGKRYASMNLPFHLSAFLRIVWKIVMQQHHLLPFITTLSMCLWQEETMP